MWQDDNGKKYLTPDEGLRIYRAAATLSRPLNKSQFAYKVSPGKKEPWRHLSAVLTGNANGRLKHPLTKRYEGQIAAALGVDTATLSKIIAGAEEQATRNTSSVGEADGRSSREQGPEPIATGTTEHRGAPYRLIPQPGANRVERREYLEKQGLFHLAASFYAVVGRSDVQIIFLRFGYYVQGCLSGYSGKEYNVFLGPEDFPSGAFGDTEFTKPVKLGAETTHLVQIFSHQKPPLKHQTISDIDADHGDLVIETTLRVSGEDHFRQARWVFSFDPDRDPKEVAEIREPPRLTNGELDAWRALGKLADDQYQRLMALSPDVRYLASISQPGSDLTQEATGREPAPSLSEADMLLLQALHRAGPPTPIP